jgi:Zn-finger nucleic acid-binding protein
MAGNQVNEDEVQVGSETTKVCPVCQTLLSDGNIQGKPVLYCSKCRGMLVSMDKFLPLVECLRALRRPSGLTLEPRDNSDEDRRLSCPECAQTMVGYPYGGPGNVNIDSCERCSLIWLDNHELWRIVLAPDHYPVYSSYDGVST